MLSAFLEILGGGLGEEFSAWCGYTQSLFETLRLFGILLAAISTCVSCVLSLITTTPILRICNLIHLCLGGSVFLDIFAAPLSILHVAIAITSLLRQCLGLIRLTSSLSSYVMLQTSLCDPSKSLFRLTTRQ